MHTPLKNRYDFVLVFDVQDGNPNGDPDAGNLPRVDPETGRGLVTDVCLKRKVRNFVQITKTGEDGKALSGYDIYVKEKAVLGRAHVKAFNDLNISTGKISEKEIPADLQSIFDDLVFPDGLSVATDESGERQMLVVAADADKKIIQQWIKEEDPPKEAAALIKTALKDAKPRKPTGEETELGKGKMCEDYYDIRTFGAVMSLKSAPNCGQVRGPVQMTFARSVDPILTLEHSITRMAVATEAEAEKQSGDNRTMGRKHTVPYGAYIAHGFISAHLAAQTKFSEEDLEILWNALTNMFEHDRSAARGLMATRGLIVFKHDSALGNAPGHKLFELVQVKRKTDPSIPAREFGDYEIVIDKARMPASVKLDAKV
ncbi:MAG: type I-C CRISPR-associated protein Cas7/Csd2 [Deltaproteobacteria bacterium]|nr:type I-C CRISPR-associated protein Cas7/Csd2 [Deltaproteobacteria bacterium]